MSTFVPPMTSDVYQPSRQQLDHWLMTKAEVAQFLKVNPRTVRRWAREGLIREIVLTTGTLRYTT